MGAVATFDYAQWKARYPEFFGVPETLADAYFAEATLYLRNDGMGPVQDAGQQRVLLNMLTAHIAALNAVNADGSPASTLVGPITSASEGSVSVGTGLVVEAGTAGWFQSTKYGAQFLAASAPYRSARYVPSRKAGYGFGFGFCGPARGW